MNSFKFLNILLFSSICIAIISGFNISPKPNLVLKEPTTGRYLPKLRSSYFGYTVLLKHRSIFIGAPRAQSSIESQRNINETGLLYKCSLETGSSGHCTVYLIDKNGNEHSEDNEHTIDSKKKDYQWLGGSLDGGTKDSEPLIVCAPRMKAETAEDYLMHGICYRTPNTFDEQPTVIKIISPLKGTSQQIWGNSFVYAFGESGLSVHWTGDKDEILIGAPGIQDWKGSVIRYRAEEDKGLGGLQKRDVNSQMAAQKEKNQKFVSAVPNPNLWNQPEFSYFGYSESSGYFSVESTRKLLYVASAPRANNYDGEVYIYDIIVEDSSKNYNIKKYQTFSGRQFGEFFGFTVLTEDLNGDGFTDVIVSAPLFSKKKVYDCGAVYIYLNIGKNFVFEEQLIVSPNNDPGRFGTSISLLGDINQDGFNDLAISAPFSGDGKVYIYLGSKTGLLTKPSQVIVAPNTDNINVMHMFGHGLSKGLDIDDNGYNDFAIGAPNSEAVYIYKTYPIVKIASTIDSMSREIQQDQKKLQIRVCFKMIPNSENRDRTTIQDLEVKIEADVQLKRIRFNDGNYNMRDIINLKSELNQCKIYDANINFNLRDIFKPIELKMNYDLINKVPNTEEFCDKCAALDPSMTNSNIHKISFSTGCSGVICVADLILSSTGLSDNFILGSSKVITVEYKIRNEGETAYVPQLNVTSSNSMPFAKVPPMCNGNAFVLVCDLNRGQPMHIGQTDLIKINFDASHIDVKYLEIIAKVFSTGNEKNSIDNSVVNRITMVEKSSVEVIKTNNNELIALDEKSGIYEFVNKFEIKNIGPSLIKEATITLSLPLLYLVPKTTNHVTIISQENITFSANYASYALTPTYYQNGTVIPHKIQSESKSNYISPSIPSDELHASRYDQSKFGYDLEQDIETLTQNDNQNYATRRRRFIESDSNTETQNKTKTFARITEQKTPDSIKDDLTGTLPISRVTIFHCHDTIESKCLQIMIKVNNFRVSTEHGVNIELKYTVDLDEINKVLIDEKEFFFIANEFNITRTGDEKRESIEIPKSAHYVIVSKHQLGSTPVWVIILSVLAGLLLLALIIFGLYKLGFFKRKKPDITQTADHATQPMIEPSNQPQE